MVRQRFAKPLYAGSNPVLTSRARLCELDIADGVPRGVWCESDPGFADELRRRVARADSGEDAGFDADEVFAELWSAGP